MLVSTESKQLLPVKGLHEDERIVGWTSDSRSAFVTEDTLVDATFVNETKASRVFQLDLTSGQRKLWKEIKLDDPAGLIGTYVIVTPDGAAYGFNYMRVLSELYVVEGLR